MDLNGNDPRGRFTGLQGAEIEGSWRKSDQRYLFSDQLQQRDRKRLPGLHFRLIIPLRPSTSGMCLRRYLQYWGHYNYSD